MHNSLILSFDLDHTLFDFDRTLHEALSLVAEHISRHSERCVNAQDLQDKRNALAQTSQGQSMSLLELRKWSFSFFLKEHAEADTLIREAMAIFTDIRFGRMHLYPDALSVLIALGEQNRLVAVTNGNTNPEKTPLAGLFEQVIFAEDCGYRKPDREIFAFMMQRMECPTARSVLHIGDSLIADIDGGNHAGFSTVWYNPDGTPNHSSIEPTYEIRTLKGLLEIVEKHRTSFMNA
ncbi:HAD family hydrolase [Cognatishimia activa]|uniref:Putative HAD-hydrolase YfnB n=1 Tax=Cognatishimia activa TaxID=1715691 RepID=A0A0P1IW49_9RHOB|nr:HAD family hydrolase [Cognatishimia activa]CUJ20699.1 Putative HAD-hydrolase YfnB [Cognatishimia activa]CUK25490.1 Putative HAD-hydrolase YfnB [Cognatishimia activa]